MEPIGTYKTSNQISRIVFFWISPFFYSGIRKILAKEDVDGASDEKALDKLRDDFIKCWNKEIKGSKPNLTRAIFNCNKVPVILLTCFVIINECVLRILQPIFFCYLLEFLLSGTTEVLGYYLFAGTVVVLFLLYTLINHYVNFLCNTTSIKLRIGLSTLLHKKCLNLSMWILNDEFLRNTYRFTIHDLKIFHSYISSYQNAFIMPIQAVIIFGILWKWLGIIWTCGIITLLLLSAINTATLKKSYISLFRMIIYSQERFFIAKYILKYIRLIKIHAFEKFFIENINFIRKKEIYHNRGIFHSKAINILTMILCDKFVLLTILLCSKFWNDDLSSLEIFVTIFLYEILKRGLLCRFPAALLSVLRLRRLTRKIEKFLTLQETAKPHKAKLIEFDFIKNGAENDEANATTPFLKSNTQSTIENSKKISKSYDEIYDDSIISMFGVSLENPANKHIILKDISLKIAEGKNIGIAGLKGSGKTTLLYMMLKEFIILKGSVHVYSEASYMPKEIELFEDTIKNNIMFYSPMKKGKYFTILKELELDNIIELLEKGDLTVLSNEIDILNKFEKRLVGIARTIYQDADIYMFDEPFVDCVNASSKQKLSKALKKLLQNKTIIITSDNITDLQDADEILVLEDQTIAYGGTYEELTAENSNVNRDLLNKNENFGRFIPEEDMYHLNATPNDRKPEDDIAVDEKAFKQYIFSSKSYIWLTVVALCLILSQLLISSADFWIAYWYQNQDICEIYFSSLKIADDLAETTTIFDENTTDFTTVGIISSDMNDQLNISQFNTSDASDPIVLDNKNTCELLSQDVLLKTYGGLLGSLLATSTFSILIFFHVAKAISLQLHKGLITGILDSKLYLLLKNPFSRLLGCLSSDIRYIDRKLPRDFIGALQTVLRIIGIYCIISYANNWLLIPITFIIGVTYGLHLYYLPLSRSLAMLNVEASTKLKSFVWSMINNVLTLRTLRCEEMNMKDMLEKLDSYYSIQFLTVASVSAIELWLDLLNVFLLICALFGFVMTKDVSIAFFGLIFTQISTLNSSEFFFKYISFKNNLACVQRVVEYSNLEKENIKALKDNVPFEIGEGRIIFKNVWYRQVPWKDPTLKNVSLGIRHKEKIAICGEKRSGKSSILNALLRLSYIDGMISIDGVLTNKVDLNSLRSKISYISQEPILFSSTFRKNLDTNSKFADDALWNVLDEVGLKQFVSSTGNGLDTVISEIEYSMTSNQKYLLSLARAVMEQNKILILDNVYDLVNENTRDVIKDIVGEYFSESTVLMTTQNLDIIVRCDKVIVMEKGCVIEFDDPNVLLQNEASAFSNLVKKKILKSEI